MVKSADDGAGDWGSVPWDHFDELARLLAVKHGTVLVVEHQGYPTKLNANFVRVIPFDPHGVQKTIGLENHAAATSEAIVAFFLRELAAWMKRRIGNYGNVHIEVSNSRAWKVTCTSCDQRDPVQ